MAAPTQAAIPRGPGKIVLNPTSTTFGSASAPYGGVYMGAVRAVELDLLDEAMPIPGEEFAGAPVDMLEGAQACILSAIFRGFDATALGAIFPNTSTGGVTGEKVINGTAQGTVRPGHLRSARFAKVLYVPDDTAKRAVILYKAMPVIAGGSRITFSILKESALEIAWYSSIDTANAGRTYKVGPVADLAIA